MSESKTKILIVEHESSDIELIQRELKKGDFNFVAEVVANERDYKNALKNFEPNIILSDYSLPSFSGPEAFAIKQKMAPQTPFVFVSGTIGEENSIELIRNGVTDYALKDKLFTLNTKIKRALKESKEKQQKIKTEIELINSERRLARAQQLAHMGSWELNFATGIAQWSDEAFRIYGLDPDSGGMTLETWLSFIHPDDLGFVKKKIKDAEQTLRDYSFVHRIIRNDGGIRHLYYEAKFEFDDTGKAVGIYGIVHDRTEIELTEESLRQSEMSIRAIFDNTDTGFLLMDLNANIVAFNQRLSQFAKHSLGAALTGGENFIRLLAPEVRRRFTDTINNVIKSGRLGFETPYPQLDGNIIWYEFSANRVSDEDGKVVGVCLAVNDITARKRAEEEIISLNKGLEEKIKQRTAELENINKELEAFSYTVSHDLQSPLRIVAGFSKIMLEDYSGKLDADGKENLKLINRMVIKMSQLTKDLLAFAQMGKATLASSEVNMNEVVKAIVEELRIADAHSTIQFKIQQLPLAMCDPRMIKQVWSNLILNAVKYSRKKEYPVIEIGAEIINGRETYYVKDNGAGFDMAHAERLFTVFQRLHSESEFEGTGVGLALVQRILLRHGGEIWAEGKVDEGAAFYFNLAAANP